MKSEKSTVRKYLLNSVSEAYTVRSKIELVRDICIYKKSKLNKH